MDVIATVFLAVSVVAWVGSAAVLVGAVIAFGRPDHRNPVAYRWIAWHDHHTARGPR
jgi:hypothetical protein